MNTIINKFIITNFKNINEYKTAFNYADEQYNQQAKDIITS